MASIVPNALPSIAGGTPVRSEFLPFARPSLGVEEERAVLEVLRSGWISTGPVTQSFERSFADFVGVPEAIAVSSCTAGLRLTLTAFEIGPGCEVITSPMTFPATANAILQVGATPVLADVLPGQLTLDPERVERAITPSTRAILVVHYAGWPCEMDALGALAKAHGLRLIEDAAHALGASYGGRPAGSLGDAAVFSFYATKNITTGDGGMITTERADVAERLRCEGLHGIDLDATRRREKDYAHWEAVAMGWKANLTDIASAIGLAQMEKLPRFLQRRRDLDGRYRRELATLPVEMVTGPHGSVPAAHLFPLLLRLDRLRVDRDFVLRGLLAENIGVGVHFRALAQHRFFRDKLGVAPEQFPVAMDASNRLLSLPLDACLSDDEQGDVIEALVRLLQYCEA